MSKTRQDEWRDISTAPCDGTRILACVYHPTDPLIGIIKWVDTSREVDKLVSEKGNRKTYETRMESSGYFDPEGIDVYGATHWQPLPAPPGEQPATEPREALRDAAPDLLAALKACAWEITNHPLGHTPKFMSVGRMADAAIAKAEAPQTAQPQPEQPAGSNAGEPQKREKPPVTAERLCFIVEWLERRAFRELAKELRELAAWIERNHA